MIHDRSTDVVLVLQNWCAMLGTNTGRDRGRSNSMLASCFLITSLRTAKRKCFAKKGGGSGDPYPLPLALEEEEEEEYILSCIVHLI